MKHPGFPLPDTSWEPTRGFWEGAAASELRIPRCDACGSLNWYPPPACRHCGGEALTWRAVSGRGQLFSWSHVTRALFKEYASKAPYIPGIVVLDEDPRVRLVTLLVDCNPEGLVVDEPVECVFRPLSFSEIEGEVIAPMFRPIQGG
ncbi:OB-fold domain-containing protein [Myxococcota bacterium]|nr:OB-fold domain-containing protein [Myxococcota bacterium]